MRRWLLLLLAALPAPVGAQAVVTSAAPESVSVTVYRDPERGEGAIDAQFPEGFALVSEKRRITLPAGESTIRFEGVADGMIAVSAVVTGLPGGVVQKNRDAKLLSPAALVDGTLGRAVHLRRTDPATGKVTEQDAIIRSASSQALVLETAQGVEGLRCSGLPETLSYDSLPADLSIRPTLSVTTQSPAAGEAEVTLTYLSTGFDWAAHYVARIGADGRTMDLFAWLTVANGNGTGFAQAGLLAVAGRLNRTSDHDSLEEDAPSPFLALRCWRFAGYDAAYGGAPPPAPPPPPMLAAPAMMMERATDIVLTSRRIARQEDLGDLKLYRVPMTVDINARAQKQVALLRQNGIAFESYHAADLVAGDAFDEPRALRRMIRFENKEAAGAGVPLPSGGITLFAPRGSESLLLADGRMRDHAKGETVRIEAGESAQQAMVQEQRDDKRNRGMRLTLTNADSRPAAAEIEIADSDGARLVSPSRRIVRRDGLWLWKAVIPAHGAVSLDYRIRE
ncbi:DUF4139 domain-containing protein [Sphingobium cloacae]|uniref:DUF4139 domain-containing protein n=1 Tax=Sphingobium cloacae TaxID=120107 RepID=A0A1E1F439_9SPHN|nr:hypothetical protein [Sphingobium cloacae]BAV65286.1 hypothetical protein SCLO_1022460 [Sphingobium cloacae]